MNKKIPFLIKGGVWEDSRGKVKFNNTFDFKKIKRFYEVSPNSKNKIRAFHGHFKEEKYVYVVSGSIIIYAVKLSNKINPSKKAKIYKFTLKTNESNILFIPKGYANGFKILEKNTRIIFYSNLTTEQSKKDDFRFDENYWGEILWQEN